jgi:glycosyltransferase involved in cell wall biosynthesis
LTVARLTDKQKRTSDLIRAMCHLSADWKLEIIGVGPDRELLETLSKKLGVDSRVNFLGFRSRAEVRSFMRSCGVYAMPSANEAMCLAVLEAMSCGAAVVASSIRTFQSLITNNVDGMLFPVGDVEALAQAIDEAWLLKDRVGPAAAISVSQRFDSKKLYRQLSDSMRSIVSSQTTSFNKQSHSTVGT